MFLGYFVCYSILIGGGIMQLKDGAWYGKNDHVWHHKCHELIELVSLSFHESIKEENNDSINRIYRHINCYFAPIKFRQNT